MKKYKTSSDGGCFLLGNETFTMNIPNGYGDGENIVYVFKDYDEYLGFLDKKYPTMKRDAFEWQGTISGTFYLYDYDCISKHEDESVLARLEGRYALYLRSAWHERPTLCLVKR